MKVTERQSGALERAIVIDMITNAAVLSAIAPKWSPVGLMSSEHTNLIASWCVRHYREYGEPPGALIQNHLDRWCERQQNEHLTASVSGLLAAISDEFDHKGGEANPQYRIDQADRHFNLVAARRLHESLGCSLDMGDLESVRQALTDYEEVRIGERSWCEPLNDPEEMANTFDNPAAEVVVEYEGAAGRFFGTSLCRDGFVALLGSDKMGKSFWLLDIAFRAMLKRKRVAYFEVGDLSKQQAKYRFYARTAERPYLSTREDRGWPCVVKVPRKLIVTKRQGERGHDIDIEYDERTFDRALNLADVEAQCDHLLRKRMKTSRSWFRLSCHPSDTVSVDDIRYVLADWERNDWVPDVVVIDYADLLATMPTVARLDERGQTNKTWKALRKMSQELHCLVVTATQSNAAAYGRELLDRRNFSEDKRKLAHVTAMFALNATAEEKEMNVQRINHIVKREGAYSYTRCLFTASCLPIANICVQSFL